MRGLLFSSKSGNQYDLACSSKPVLSPDPQMLGSNDPQAEHTDLIVLGDAE
jgi:hypothetical protein